VTGLNTAAIIDAIVSNALQLGLFDKVNTHEPKALPGKGMTAGVWFEEVEGFSRGSGLNSTSVVVTFQFRIYQNFVSEPQDAIDPKLMDAVDVLFGQYSGDFDLGSSARNIDLLGATGRTLSARGGYINLDGQIFRVFDIFLPVIISDAWAQVA
jgi:hypothetical protein